MLRLGMGRATRRWVTICLNDAALSLSDAEIRAELASWVPPSDVWLPGAVNGRLAPQHPYALFAFAPESMAERAQRARRCRLVEQVLLDPVEDRELRRSLGRVGRVHRGVLVRVEGGALAGVEGRVVRALRNAILIRVSLRSGDRSVWVPRSGVALL